MKKKLNQFINLQIKKLKNKNLVYKIFVIYTIKHSTQNERKQFYQIEKLKRKFDDLFQKIKNYFQKSIEFLNNQDSVLNRDYTKNRNRFKNQNCSRNRIKIVKK